MKQGYVKLNLDLPEEYKQVLEIEAKEKEMSLSGLVRFIIKEYLKANGRIT